MATKRSLISRLWKKSEPPTVEVKAPPSEHCGEPTIAYTFSDGSEGQICQKCKTTLKEINGVQQAVRCVGKGEFVPA